MIFSNNIVYLFIHIFGSWIPFFKVYMWTSDNNSIKYYLKQ